MSPRLNKNVTLAVGDKFLVMSEGSHLPVIVRERAVEAIQNGFPKNTVAQAFGISRLTIYCWLERFERDGSEGLERKPGSGRPRKLEEMTKEERKSLVLYAASTLGSRRTSGQSGV